MTFYNTFTAEICFNHIGGNTRFTGIGYGMRFSAICWFSNIRNNEYNASKYGIVLNGSGSFPVIGDQGTLIGTPSVHGNKFNGLANSFSSGYKTISYVNNNTPPTFYHSSLAGFIDRLDPSTAFPDVLKSIRPFALPSSVNYTCAPITVPPDFWATSAFSPEIADGNAGSYMEEGYEAAGKWMVELALYKHLKSDIAMRNSEQRYIDFFEAKSGEDIGRISDYEDKLVELNDSLNHSDSALYSQKISEARELNDDIPGAATGNLTANYVRTNEIYLNFLTLGIDSITSDDKQFIDSIAAQCPFIAGEAVYIARSLYALRDTALFFDDIELCRIITSGKTDGTEINADLGAKRDANEKFSLDLNEYVGVFPNPAKDLVKMIYYIAGDEAVEISFTNLLGQQIINNSLPAGSNQTEINTAHLNHGIYLWQMKRKGRLVENGKLCIIK